MALTANTVSVEDGKQGQCFDQILVNHILVIHLGYHGIAIRNRLAVRIAGSHPADRGSIPRYGSNHMVYSQIWPI